MKTAALGATNEAAAAARSHARAADVPRGSAAGARSRTGRAAPRSAGEPRGLFGWLARRATPQRGDVRLSHRNVYLLPSRPGLLYGTILLAMLIASINYRLSLGYALTFLLGGIGLVSILHTYRNFTGLVLRPGRAEAVFAGQLAEFTLILVNPARLQRYAVRLTAPGMARETVDDLAPAAEQLVTIALPTARRGWMAMPRLTLQSTFPLGIWRAWSYWRPDLKVIVYPTPETPAAPLPDATAVAGEGHGAGRGEDDLAAVRPYVAGDSMRRIAWKAVARSASEELLTKQFDGGQRGELVLDWNRMPAHLDAEARLSRLTRWVVDAEAAGARYALRLPGSHIDVDGGAAHRARCLEALALARV